MENVVIAKDISVAVDGLTYGKRKILSGFICIRLIDIIFHDKKREIEAGIQKAINNAT